MTKASEQTALEIAALTAKLAQQIEEEKAAAETVSLGYSKPVQMPCNMRSGLANAVQIIVNSIEAGNTREALLQAVDLHQDVIANSNPYELRGEVAFK